MDQGNHAFLEKLFEPSQEAYVLLILRFQGYVWWSLINFKIME